MVDVADYSVVVGQISSQQDRRLRWKQLLACYSEKRDVFAILRTYRKMATMITSRWLHIQPQRL